MTEIPTYEEAVKADLAEERDARLQEKFNRLGTFGVQINPMDLIAITLDSLLTTLIESRVITMEAFDDVRLKTLETTVDAALAEIAKPKLHLVK